MAADGSRAANAERRSSSRSRDATRGRPTGARGASPYNVAAMAIILPNGLTTQEIRVLQEFRRLNADSLPLEQIKAIKHPAGGGEVPAVSLVDKGYLETNGSQEAFTITQKGKDFISVDAKPMFEETSDAAASAVANPDADGV